MSVRIRRVFVRFLRGWLRRLRITWRVLKPILWPFRQTVFSKVVRAVLFIYILHWLWARSPELYLLWTSWERICILYPGLNLTEWLTRSSGWRWGKNVTFPLLKDHLQPGFIIENQDLCSGHPGKVELLLMVLSTAGNSQRRTWIRKTYAKEITKKKNVALAFFVGTPQSQTSQNHLARESRLHRDIIQTEIADIKFNIAHKELAALLWTEKHCPRLTHYVKTDDDVYVVIDRLLKFSEAHKGDKSVMYGPKFETRCFTGIENILFRRGGNLPITYKWETSYPYMIMPGWLVQTYLYPKDVMTKLIKAAFEGPFWFYQGDAIINGVCAERAGIDRIDVAQFRVSYTETFFTRALAPNVYLKWKYRDAIVVSHLQGAGEHLTENDMFDIHELMMP